MDFNNAYICRYRSIPAASCVGTYSPSDLPFYPKCADDRNAYLILPLHYHPELEILEVTAGEWHYRSGQDAGVCTAQKGDILFFQPYEPHEAMVAADIVAVKTRCICLDPGLFSHAASQDCQSMAKALTDGTLRIQQKISADLPESPALRAQFSRMLEALDAPERVRESVFLGALYTMLGILEDGAYLHVLDKPAKKEEIAFTRAVIDYTEAHISEKLTTASVSAALSYNESYFCRIFKKQFHMCYGDYCTLLRVKKAQTLLPGMSVTETAAACGYSHLSYFSAVFRRMTGMTPEAYKRCAAKQKQGEPTAL